MDISGLYYFKLNTDYNYIVDLLDNNVWINTAGSNSRRVQQYGYAYNYNSGYNNSINTKIDDIPVFMTDLINEISKICKELNLIDDSYQFNQCIVNNYESGQGISKHIDNLNFGPVIACVTLGKGCVMTYSHNNEERELYVENNSLYIMSGDARYKWYHEMKKCKYDYFNFIKFKRDRRISLTFRNVNS